MQFAGKLTELGIVRLLTQHSSVILSVITLAGACFAAAFWPLWPGDTAGVALLHPIQGTYLDTPLRAINSIGSDLARITLLLVTIGFLSVKRRPRTAIIFSVIIGSELALIGFLKWVIQRPRPISPETFETLLPAATNSFPSGHTSFTVAFFGCVAYLCIFHWARMDLRRKLLILLILLPAVLIGPARVAAGDHWPSDIIGSYLIALFAIKIFVLAHKHYNVPRSPRNTTREITRGQSKIPPTS
jgi:membrane-associated phospholipid phosphatase